MDLLSLVLPIFSVILLGFLLKKTRVFDEAFVQVLNQLVYRILLPVLVFWEISRASFRTSFNPRLVVVTYVAMGLLWLSIFAAGWIFRLRPALVGSLNQGSFRGNLAYIGLALVFNVYGSPGLGKAGVLAGFMIPFMNFFSILALKGARSFLPSRKDWSRLAVSIFLNPLMLASFAGLLFSFFSLQLPLLVAGSLRLIASLSLPLALISLGGSLSFRTIRGKQGPVLLAVMLKLLVLPFLGHFLLRGWGILGLDYRITILLLACPTAVVTYVMAVELGGDPDLSAAIVMLSTLVSMITLPVWVWIIGL